MIRVAHRVACTEAEGPGRRYALWTQGCRLRCAGCCNPEYLSIDGGLDLSVLDLLAEIASSRDANGIGGISLLGGEPTAQSELPELAAGVQALGLGVMLYSGYTLGALRGRHDALLAATDILVDGPYDRTQPEAHRRWVGSANQQVHFLSDRYRKDDPCWRKPNTIEIRVTPSAVTVNGFPARGATGLWKGWR